MKNIIKVLGYFLGESLFIALIANLAWKHILMGVFHSTDIGYFTWVFLIYITKIVINNIFGIAGVMTENEKNIKQLSEEK